ncbi:proteasome maturation ans ribosome synthesis protein Nop10, putative [Talaromyces stipitatus ATCC 10500]|uniref:20S-pre-rRNA D-site endonuclease NOB1 n=1 Tax=Talaromyces stipitatus (strain ATCC 10500 / CBS 375.48 / QM 6759 / NRRL 1006) TaxID=441959 RepID=B8M9R5_TALSN|nr:proteasome maturation ans ribosome synthesis protein Nop10, putative [Talaromyces stipitatus ATCC 10500]EED18067.1 proteasome maturation ans ribosome synthesis protein Nop10, putative [Talaromyces stipitatus ATCC 10500]
MAEQPAPTKPVHTIVLDAGPILKNVPPLSTLLAQAEDLVTTPAVVGEIRDPVARSRFETLYLPFLKQRSPSPKSVQVISEFARKTGDRAVLSKVDIEVLALAYEIECEKNGGDWRLRSVPGQKRVNGKPPVKEGESAAENTTAQEGVDKATEETKEKEEINGETSTADVSKVAEELAETTIKDDTTGSNEGTEAVPETTTPIVGTTVEDGTEDISVEIVEDEEEGEDSDGGGEWITPSNIKKKQARDEEAGLSATPEPKVMQVATMTTDFACQNVLLQMNLNLLSTTTLQRIRHLRTFVKRCHACFSITKEMNKQFCPRCGKDTLTRVSCSTDANGQFKLHLKKNMQWNNRGNVFSVPKPIHGSANGKWKGGGGQGGWGTGLILAEDQKEYVRAVTDEKRQQRRERDLMDEDYLPGILTGERHRSGGRVKVGAGRNVNSRRR